MAYLNNYSLKYTNHELQDSETDFLKQKLIQTHQKLMNELEYSKQLEDKLKEWQQRYEATMAQNESLVKKYNNLSAKYEKDKMYQDKSKLLQLNLVQSQKKNDLLRIDLQTMRTKMLELTSYKDNLQESNNKLQTTLHKHNEKLGMLQNELKVKENTLVQLTEDVERFKLKFEKQIVINRQIERDTEKYKKQLDQIVGRYGQLQMVMKQEKDRQSKIVNQLLGVQKELKQSKQKSESLNEELIEMRQENHILKVRGRQEERNLSLELQKLTGQFNNLHALYKQKEYQLEEAKRKPIEDISRKKDQFQQTKQLVGKLDREQKAKFAERNSPSKTKELSPRINSKNYTRSYKEEKEEYLSIIQSVGSMQNQMLNCNIERKKILAQIDKIDETRVKTKEMISRRRRLQVQLQNYERKLQSIRNELKKLKVI